MSTTTVTLKAPDHPIKSVIIFQSSTAELTRSFTVDLQAGRNILEISGLSSNVDTESPRIHGLGADARVFDISCTVRPLIKRKNTRNADEVRKLMVNKATLELERNLRQREYDMLDEAGKALANEVPAQLDSFVDNVVRRKRAAMQAVLELNGKIEEAEEELHILRTSHKGEISGWVVATVLAQHACKAEFQLTYLVTGVKWQPHYDLHANTADGKTSSEVTLLYCANVSQSTGEDWTDTILTLSTANSQALKSLSVPALDPQKGRSVWFGIGYGGCCGSAREQRGDDEYDVVDVQEAALPHGTTVDRSPLSLAYRVEGTVSLPSDGLAHKVAIAQLDFSAKLKYVCVPRKTTSAFIEGTVENTSEYELLAGPVSVFMDDGFVTKTSLGLIGVKESFNCVLGVDTALKVVYTQKSVTSHEPPRSFAEPSKTTTRTAVTTVRNGHQFDISDLVVRDALPLGDGDANIKVMLRKPDGLAQAKDEEEVAVDLGESVQDAKVRWSKVEKGKGGEKDGMFEWGCGTVAAGTEVKFEAEWDIKSPANVQWEET
ncbi:hypothetical protein C8Q80DRAFT_1269826 [Daedaleopsis nitida]|nr:hypothetical protein C8Q80DRAFT_1269826 [Daedaleopsis nitida]